MSSRLTTTAFAPTVMRRALVLTPMSWTGVSSVAASTSALSFRRSCTASSASFSSSARFSPSLSLITPAASSRVSSCTFILVSSRRRHFSSSSSTAGEQKQQKEESKQENKEENKQQSSGGGSFFTSDSWTKTVGTIGAFANWAIPAAGITHIFSGKDAATTIDPLMTSSLAIYSIFFMRWAIAVTPANYPLLICHVCNEVVQLVQLGRYVNAVYIEKKPTVAAITTGKKEEKAVVVAK